MVVAGRVPKYFLRIEKYFLVDLAVISSDKAYLMIRCEGKIIDKTAKIFYSLRNTLGWVQGKDILTTDMMNGLHTFAAAAAGETAEETSEGIGALGLSLPAIIASLITFTVLFIVVKKFALSSIVANLEKREEDINRGLHLTAEMDKKSAELEMTVEKALKNARKEADLIIAEANAETGKMIQAAEEKATQKAEDILRAAEGKIERDITEARQGLKAEMAGLITEATEAILNQKLDAPSDRKLVENYLKGAMK